MALSSIVEEQLNSLSFRVPAVAKRERRLDAKVAQLFGGERHRTPRLQHRCPTDDLDPVFGDAEMRLQLGGRERRWRQDEGCTFDDLLHPRWKLAFVVVMQRRQVVHHHHESRIARRWQIEAKEVD